MTYPYRWQLTCDESLKWIYAFRAEATECLNRSYRVYNVDLTTDWQQVPRGDQLRMFIPFQFGKEKPAGRAMCFVHIEATWKDYWAPVLSVDVDYSKLGKIKEFYRDAQLTHLDKRGSQDPRDWRYAGFLLNFSFDVNSIEVIKHFIVITIVCASVGAYTVPTRLQMAMSLMSTRRGKLHLDLDFSHRDLHWLCLCDCDHFIFEEYEWTLSLIHI